MKHLIILGDGMADWAVPSLGNKTLLQYAHTPYMDMLARMGRTGMLKTVADGFHPGSEVANMSVMGYDLPTVYEGRGVLEAASIGVDLAPDDMAMRCNLVRIHFYTGVQYRHLLVVKGGNKHVACVPPHDIPLQPFRPNLVKALVPEAQETADLLNGLILKSQELLAEHPLNLKRVSEGKDPANSIWPWSPGYRPKMEALSNKYPAIRKGGSVITAVDLIRGIGRYAGLRCIDVEGATGLYTTNYEGKAQAAIDALKTDDFVYLHIEASDEAGHEGDIPLKLKTIEYLDQRAIKPIWEAVKDWDEPVAIAVLPDHPTPCELRTHTAEPIPFLIYYPGIEPDEVQTYDEVSCQKGGYGMLEKDEFMNLFMNN